MCCGVDAESESISGPDEVSNGAIAFSCSLSDGVRDVRYGIGVKVGMALWSRFIREGIG